MNYGQRGITGAGAPRRQDVVDARPDPKATVRLTCKRCGAVVYEQKLRSVKAEPRTFAALARQATRKHDAGCEKRGREQEARP